jgi:hypothetical protein
MVYVCFPPLEEQDTNEQNNQIEIIDLRDGVLNYNVVNIVNVLVISPNGKP